MYSSFYYSVYEVDKIFILQYFHGALMKIYLYENLTHECFHAQIFLLMVIITAIGFICHECQVDILIGRNHVLQIRIIP